MKEGYFEQKREPILGRLEKIPDDFSKPLGIANYRENGKIEFQKDNLNLKLSYEPVGETDLSPEEMEALGVNGENLRTLKKLESLILIGKEGETLDLAPFFSFGIKIFFFTEKKINGLCDNYSLPGRKIILMTDDILKPSSILSLLHEIGHCVNYESRKNKNPRKGWDVEEARIMLNRHIRKKNVLIFGQEMKIQLNKQDFKKISPLILENERDAWAFALKKIKPFLDKEPLLKRNVLTYVHNFCLQGYSDYFRRESGGFSEKVVDKIMKHLEKNINPARSKL